MESNLNKMPNDDKLIAWSGLSVTDKAIVAAYIESGYSAAIVADELDMFIDDVKSRLRYVPLQLAIKEVQNDFANFDFLNENWAKAQLLRLLPKVMAEEDVIYIDNKGEVKCGKRFLPEVGLNIIKYLVPNDVKQEKSEQPFVFNINVPSTGK